MVYITNMRSYHRIPNATHVSPNRIEFTRDVRRIERNLQDSRIVILVETLDVPPPLSNNACPRMIQVICRGFCLTTRHRDARSHTNCAQLEVVILRV